MAVNGFIKKSDGTLEPVQSQGFTSNNHENLSNLSYPAGHTGFSDTKIRNLPDTYSISATPSTPGTGYVINDICSAQAGTRQFTYAITEVGDAGEIISGTLSPTILAEPVTGTVTLSGGSGTGGQITLSSSTAQQHTQEIKFSDTLKQMDSSKNETAIPTYTTDAAGNLSFGKTNMTDIVNGLARTDLINVSNTDFAAKADAAGVAGTWGKISGNIDDQTDLINKFTEKITDTGNIALVNNTDSGKKFTPGISSQSLDTDVADSKSIYDYILSQKTVQSDFQGIFDYFGTQSQVESKTSIAGMNAIIYDGTIDNVTAVRRGDFDGSAWTWVPASPAPANGMYIFANKLLNETNEPFGLAMYNYDGVHDANFGTEPMPMFAPDDIDIEVNQNGQLAFTASANNRINSKEPAIAPGTAGQFYAGDKTFKALTAGDVPALPYVKPGEAVEQVELPRHDAGNTSWYKIAQTGMSSNSNMIIRVSGIVNRDTLDTGATDIISMYRGECHVYELLKSSASKHITYGVVNTGTAFELWVKKDQFSIRTFISLWNNASTDNIFGKLATSTTEPAGIVYATPQPIDLYQPSPIYQGISTIQQWKDIIDNIAIDSEHDFLIQFTTQVLQNIPAGTYSFKIYKGGNSGVARFIYARSDAGIVYTAAYIANGVLNGEGLRPIDLYQPSPVETITTTAQWDAVMAKVPSDSEYSFAFTTRGAIIFEGNNIPPANEWIWMTVRKNSTSLITAIAHVISGNTTVSTTYTQFKSAQGNGRTGWDIVGMYQPSPVEVITTTDQWDAVMAKIPANSVYEFRANVSQGILTGVSVPYVTSKFTVYRVDAANVIVEAYLASGGYPTLTTWRSAIGNGRTGWDIVGGSSSLTGRTDANTLLGVGAGNSITTGSGNVAVGTDALKSATLLTNNVAIGNQALMNSDNTYTINNVAIGHQALLSNTIGNGNVAVGTSTLSLNTTGGANTAVGQNALQRNTTGANSVAVGQGALFNNTTGGANTAVGVGALNENTVGSNNVAVGYGALGDNINFTNVIGLGNSVQATASNQVVLGNENITALRCQVTSITALSDERSKEQIEVADAEKLTAALMAIPVKRYKFRDDITKQIDTHRLGFIAQDVQPIFPKSVSEAGDIKDEDGNVLIKDSLELTQDFAVPVLWGVVQQQQKEIEQLKWIISDFEARLTALDSK